MRGDRDLELNNRVTRDAGGRDCIWSGMNSGSVTAQSRSFRDLKEICRRADIVMLDHQRRDDDTGFQQNGDTGKRVHGLLGWDKLAPATATISDVVQRLLAKPPARCARRSACCAPAPARRSSSGCGWKARFLPNVWPRLRPETQSAPFSERKRG